MKTKLLTFLIVSATFGSSFVMAQEAEVEPPHLAIKGTEYRTALGVRGGVTSGLTIKHFLNNKDALKGILGVRRHGLSTTLLYERYVSAYKVEGLNWYYGVGGHGSFETGQTVYFENDNRYKYRDDGWGLGIDAIFGIEYKVPDIPLAFSFDLKPFIEYNSYDEVWLSIDPGIGAKVTF